MAENTVPTLNEGNNAVANREETREPERFVTPAVDIYENGEGLVVVADMPGLQKSDIDISTEKDILSIKGSARESFDQEWAYQEYEPVGYYREFRLSEKIDQENIQAEYKNGVLKVKLPFAEEQKPRKIDVKVD